MRKKSSPFSDQGPENPKLGNRPPQRNRPAPPTSGMTGQDGVWDYFRDPKNPRRLQTSPDTTITPARVALSVRMRWNPVLGLTAERLVNYLDQWRLGFFRQAGMLWDQIERRDYMLQTVAPKRKKAVARNGFEVVTVAEIPAGLESLAVAQQKFLKYFYDHISVTTALEPDEQGGFALLVRQMMDAIGKRYAVHEIVWQPDAASNLTAKFIFCPIWWFEGTRGKLRFLESEFQVYGKDMNPGEWLVTVHDGLMEASSLLFVLKHTPLKAWACLCDKFGQPGILGRSEAPYGSKEWNNFVEAVNKFSQDWSAITSSSGEISLIEPRTAINGGENLFSTLVERMDKAITTLWPTLWRGADLGTSSKTNSTGASLQADETNILETDDARIADETLTAQVSRYALAWKFGPDTPQLAYLKIRVPETKNVDLELKTDQFLVQSGAPLGVKNALERYGRQSPEPGEATLTAPVINSAPPARNPQSPTGEGEAEQLKIQVL
jgi:phage gp29-like protein